MDVLAQQTIEKLTCIFWWQISDLESRQVIHIHEEVLSMIEQQRKGRNQLLVSTHTFGARHVTFLINQPTDSAQVGGDGVPDADAAHAEPLSDGQLQVEQWKALEYQGYQVGDEECTWVGTFFRRQAGM